ncbi:MAG TPA: chloride channel protein [Oligoflexus sp.]|uniref:chloride channel protein n=1 Tax=Oligoflexus sp. TaxID=1971216 RepID=UPI002D7EDD9A|nr:chloride channel protein [Oligoflexus sp.]HET9237509.1 chloride channel protein [Oligoflexus sp.]
MPHNLKNRLLRLGRWTLFSLVIGVLAGAGAAVFLILLDRATALRGDHPSLIFFLPLAGLAIGLVFHFGGRAVEGGTGLILEEIHNPRRIIPFRMAPLVLIGTVVTHLFGGSAGREGTAVQMGASLADQLSRFFTMENVERRILLVAGAGAGFSAAIGAPWAGTLFGLEVMQIGKLRFFALFECCVASFVAYATCRFLGAPHTFYPSVTLPAYDATLIACVALSGIIFGLAAQGFMKLTHAVERLQKKLFKFPPWRPLAAGFILVALYQLPDTIRYAGLGLPVIVDAFAERAGWLDPLLKGGFTALTVGSGFKGGEFIPLVFMGSTLGSALSSVLPVATPLLAALGFAAVFGAAANTPIACTIMAMEIFGWNLGPLALLACWVAYQVTGHVGIYKNQTVARSKRDQLLLVFPWWRK